MFDVFKVIHIFFISHFLTDVLDISDHIVIMRDGNIIRISFPTLTEDKRKAFVKDVKKLGEDAKVAIRNVRREQNDKVKLSEKDKKISEDESKKIQEEIQKITDNFIKDVDKIVDAKEKELLTV